MSPCDVIWATVIGPFCYCWTFNRSVLLQVTTVERTSCGSGSQWRRPPQSPSGIHILHMYFRSSACIRCYCNLYFVGLFCTHIYCMSLSLSLSLFCGSSWGFSSSAFFPLARIKSLSTDVVQRTDWKAHWGDVIFGYINNVDLRVDPVFKKLDLQVYSDAHGSRLAGARWRSSELSFFL